MPPGAPVTSDSDIDSVLSMQTEKPKIRRNSGEPKYYCSIEGCCQSFKRLDHLDRHEYKHTGIKKHACHYDDCSKAYTIVTHLKRHIRSTHEKQEKQPIKNVPCEVDTCDKLFTSVCNMQRHIREVHENAKVYKCEFCEEKFTQKLKMRRHEISKHTGVYPYNCDKCSRGFYQKWQWEKHEETCKVYPCLTCEKIFEKWTLFLKHCKETQHTRQYYKCEYCEKAYVKPAELQKHVAAKHLEDENGTTGAYKCSHKDCQRSYAYEKNLRQHIATAHQGKRFKCVQDGCEKEFSSSQNLQKHLKRDCCSKLPIDEAPSTSKASLKRKKRKDAGKAKISTLSKLSGIAVSGELNKRLKCRDEYALEEVTTHLSQEIYMHSSSDADRVEDQPSGLDTSKNCIVNTDSLEVSNNLCTRTSNQESLIGRDDDKNIQTKFFNLMSEIC